MFHQSSPNTINSATSPFRSAIVLLRPFDAFVWLFSLASVLLLPLVAVPLARVETARCGRHATHWRSYARTAWYIFGTLMGDSVGMERGATRVPWAMR